MDAGGREKAGTSQTREKQKRMWDKLWKLPIKNKLKHFGWKCFHGWLSINSAVRRRGVEIDEVCKHCGQEKETIEHAFLHCPE